MKSIESFFQGIKFKDIDMQDLVFNYSGLDSNHVKVCSGYDWKKTGMVYWQGKEIDYDNRDNFKLNRNYSTTWKKLGNNKYRYLFIEIQ